MNASLHHFLGDGGDSSSMSSGLGWNEKDEKCVN